MLTNLQLIQRFLEDCDSGARNGSLSIHSGDRLFSYSTCIAEFLTVEMEDVYDTKIIVNATRYSNTTSHHTSLLRREAEKHGFELRFTTKHVPIGTKEELYRYL